RNYRRGNVVVGVAGGYSDAFLNRATAVFATLPEGKTPKVELPPASAPNGIEVQIVEKPCIATAISMGFPIDVTRADPDFLPLRGATPFLGEHPPFKGGLMQHMRGLRVLNNEAFSYIETSVEQGKRVPPAPNTARRRHFSPIWTRPVAHADRHFALREAA